MQSFAGNTRELDVVFKYDGEQTAYGLYAEAQAYPDWKRPDSALTPGSYMVNLRIAGRNVRTRRAAFGLVVPEAGQLRFTRRR